MPPNSTALIYRQWAVIDNSGSGAGQQYNHVLWNLYQYFMTDPVTIDSGRWRLVDASAIVWAAAANVVDNSWFVVEAFKGRRQWQVKFQATNVAALDESPGITYCLVANICSGGGWTAKGGANGGFAASSLVCSGNRLLGGLSMAGSNGSLLIHGDRDTVLVAFTPSGTSNWTSGAYVGRFEPESSAIPYPEALLTAWDGFGSPKGFDRSSSGVFSTSPSGNHHVLSSGLVPTSQTAQVWTSGWLDTSHQPSSFSGAFTSRPLEISGPDAPLGYLRLVWAVSGMTAGSRLDARQKLVLHAAAPGFGVAIQHNGLASPP